MATCFLAPLAVLARAVAACARAGGGPTARAACAACRHSNFASRYDAYNAHTGHNAEDQLSRLFFMLTKQAKTRTARRPHISALLFDTLARAPHLGRQLSQTTWRRCSAAHAGCRSRNITPIFTFHNFWRHTESHIFSAHIKSSSSARFQRSNQPRYRPSNRGRARH